MSLQRFIDMRYLGQWRSLAVPVAAPLDIDAAIDGFHAEHEREHNYRRDGSPVEIYRLTLRAAGAAEAELARHDRNGSAWTRWGASGALRRARRSGRDAGLLALRRSGGSVPRRPAVLEQLDSTVLVPPGVGRRSTAG